MHPLISVVIPVWNRPEFLKISANSVLSQTYPHFELIIVDDGSDDNTLEVAYRIADDKRVKVIEKEHSGTTDTFNRGVKEVQGDVFCLLGSDDFWEPTKLEEQVKVHLGVPGHVDHVLHTESHRIDVNGNPQKDVYKSNVLKELGGTTPDCFIKRHLKKPFACFFGSSLFVPINVLRKVPNFPDSIGQDYHWVLKAALLYDIPFTLVPKHLIRNRTNPNSTTGKRGKEILKEAVAIWKSVIEERKRIKL